MDRTPSSYRQTWTGEGASPAHFIGEIMNRRGFLGALIPGAVAVGTMAQVQSEALEVKQRVSGQHTWIARGIDVPTQDDTSIVMLVDGKKIVSYRELTKSLPDYVRVRRGSGI
jgi:hypothetical protein